MNRKKMISIGFITAMLIASGCQKSPEYSIVKNKDFEKMVTRAQDEENGISDVAKITEYDTYQETFSDKSLGVTVKVDAKVDIPKTDQMSMIRIRQKEISQEFLDQVKEALMPEITLCDAKMLHVPTKSGIEEEIRQYKRWIEELEANVASGQTDEQSRDIIMEEYQQGIDDLQEAYESAPVSVDPSDYPSDGRLHLLTELVEQDPDYYQWQLDLNKNGSVFYGVGEGADGYHSLYAQNNENYGNSLVYRRCSEKYLGNGAVSVTSPLGNGYVPGDVWRASEEPDIDLFSWDEMREIESDAAGCTLEEARRISDEFMQKLNLKEYSCYDGDLYCEDCQGEPGVLEYRKLYIFQYLRNLDGVYVSNESLSKFTGEWQGDEYVKREWPGESVLVYVNDSGIAGFYYLAPVEPVETVVEKASMKNFEEIKDIFRQMIVVTNASEVEDIIVEVDRVALRYTRISEADTFDTGLLVPVWDFEGKIIGGRYNTGSLLTINAIDGSIIDRELGY